MILDFTIEEIMRFSSIKRWGIIEMSKEQSVAEHSYNVAMISIELLKHLEEGEQYIEEVLTYSLYHDLPELYTGDMPSSIKRHIGGHITVAEKKMFPEFYKFKEKISDTTIMVCKVSDLLDAIQYARKFCVDSRKEDIIHEMIVKVQNIAIDNEELIECIEGIWTEGAMFSRRIY